MVAVLDQAEHAVAALDRLEQVHGVPPGDVGVLLALQHANRRADRHRARQDRPGLAVLHQLGGERDRLRFVAGGQRPFADQLQGLARIGRKPGPEQLGCEIHRRRQQHQRLDPLGPRQRHQAGEPGAHGGAHQHGLAVDQLVQSGHGVLAPVGDGAVAEAAFGGAVAGIVEPHVRPARSDGPAGQRLGLGPGHVGGEAAQPYHRRPAALQPPVRQAPAPRRVEHAARLAHGVRLGHGASAA